MKEKLNRTLSDRILQTNYVRNITNGFNHYHRPQLSGPDVDEFVDLLQDVPDRRPLYDRLTKIEVKGMLLTFQVVVCIASDTK